MLFQLKSIAIKIDGELQGTRQNNQYIYDYIPKGKTKHREIFRRIFEEKFVICDNICLSWTRALYGSLPVDWIFLIKPSDIADECTMIEVRQNDNSDRLEIFAVVGGVDIFAYESDNKVCEIKLDDHQPVLIRLIAVVKNLD